ncbi:short-chain dehydrogenase [Phialemonium atrogriseum]|uniref:Short-chain dehydrogenase n=1 Tax=Phialemonium atrogriseum TaxID=1093897 RepID=A0AAJ0C808_9PEZI|nr:short-chain dehydrogenase [Phialemonium atrogriseum]KAK1770407.1 short-chain dehydrogenase [Phialemonium atrogriseum]
MDENTIYLVTGAGRGLGRGLVETLLLRPNTTVIAATRTPTPFLTSLPARPGNRLILVTIDSASPTSALAAAEHIREEHGIARLDVVIANAGVGAAAPAPVAEVPVRDVHDCVAVNAVAPLLLFQATWPLLERAAGPPKFVVISSVAGSLGRVSGYAPLCAAYGMSKAAVNFLVRRMGRENERLVALALHPGWVQTDMGNAAAVRLGMTEAPVEISTSARGILQEIDSATKESSETFYTFDHQKLPW